MHTGQHERFLRACDIAALYTQGQFIQGDHVAHAITAPTQAAAPTDTAVYSDQYATYSGYPNVKPSVAHV